MLDKAEATTADFQALKHDMEALRSDVKALFQALTNDGKHKLDDVRTRVWRAAQNLESRTQQGLTDGYDAVRRQGRAALDSSREQVAEHPLTIVLGALAAGFVLGILGSRRS